MTADAASHSTGSGADAPQVARDGPSSGGLPLELTDPQGDDPRLLLPAGAAWAAVALTLGEPPFARLVAGGASMATAVVVGWAVAGGRLPRRRCTAAGEPSTAGTGPRGASRGASRGRRPGLPRGARAAGALGARREPSAVGATLAFLLATTGVCLCASGLHGLLRTQGPLPALAEAGVRVRLVGAVTSDPRTIPGRTARGDDLVLVRLSVESVEGRGRRSGARGRVLVFGGRDWLAAGWGQRVEARGRLAPSRPGDDVVATLDARGPPRMVRRAGPVARAADRLRAGLRRACEDLPADERGLLPGLVVGDTSQQPAELGTAMKATGLTHLAAVSGTNITIVCAVALGVARLAGLGRRLRSVLAGLVLVGFVVLARPEPSVLRAAVMGGLALVGLLTARSRAATPALAVAVVLLLAHDPWLARSYGFALSVLATAGLLLFARPWSRALGRWLPGPVALALAVPAAAQVACGPVLVLLAGRISLVALPANLLCEPLVAPATVLGLTAALVSPASPGLAAVIAHVAGWPCAMIAWTARELAALPLGQLPWPGGAVGALALAALTLVVVLGLPSLARRARDRPREAAAVACGLLALGAALTAPVPGRPTWPPAGWVLVACDVGQGDALVLASGSGRAVLVDAGPDPAAVDGCLRRLGVRALDAVVLTHFHADHVDGLAGALRGRRAGELLVTLVDDPPERARDVRQLARAEGVRVRTPAVGAMGGAGSVQWVVLAPQRVIHDGSVPNNASIVLLVRSHGLRLLLLGDVEPAAARLVARRLRETPGGEHVDVLKVAHHGSALQDPGLLAWAAPRLALVSVGADNDYGHPAPSTLQLLAALGAVVGRTDRDGDLAVVATRNGPRLFVSGSRPHPSPTGRRGRPS